jgi:hypothetical protein
MYLFSHHWLQILFPLLPASQSSTTVDSHVSFSSPIENLLHVTQRDGIFYHAYLALLVPTYDQSYLLQSRIFFYG